MPGLNTQRVPIPCADMDFLSLLLFLLLLYPSCCCCYQSTATAANSNTTFLVAGSGQAGMLLRPAGPQFEAPPSQELTLRQLYDCFAALDNVCHAGGFDGLLRLDANGRTTAQWQAEQSLLSSLRSALFAAHRPEQPAERLALCFILQTPDIFDQTRPRQDPVCLRLVGGAFHLEKAILPAQRTLCRIGGGGSDTVYFLCQRSAPSPLPPTAPHRPTSRLAPPEQPESQPPDEAAVASSAAASAAAAARIRCAMMWLAGSLTALVALLAACLLVHAVTQGRPTRHSTVAAAATATALPDSSTAQLLMSSANRRITKHRGVAVCEKAALMLTIGHDERTVECAACGGSADEDGEAVESDGSQCGFCRLQAAECQL